MWLVGWQQEDFSGLESDRIACNGNFRFSFNGLYQSVEGRGVFAESLALVEGEDSDVAFVAFQDDAAYDGAFLIGDEIPQREYLRFGNFEAWWGGGGHG